MILHIDNMMREYLLDHGVRIGEDGFLTIPKSQEKVMQFAKSVRKPGVRTLAIPSMFGLTILYEGQHWTIK
jgi:hypothetical protein